MVLVGHSFELSHNSGPDPLFELVGYSLAALSVDIFFVISGFLVTTSLIHRNNLLVYIFNRALRIYPALIVAVFICVFVFGAVFTSLSLLDYFNESRTWAFLWGKSSILGLFFTGGGSDLPGVFLNNPIPGKVNGSLWTLPWELLMYVVLFAFGLISCMLKLKSDRFLKFVILFMAASCLSLLLVDYFINVVESQFVKHFLRFGAFFFFGASMQMFKNQIMVSNRLCFIGFLAICISFSNEKAFFVIYHILLVYLVLGLAYLPIEKYLKFNYLGDYSYGIYIYAFPIQQSFAVLFPNTGPLEMIAVCLPLTLMAAIFSWHWIEKPMLYKKDWLSGYLPSFKVFLNKS